MAKIQEVQHFPDMKVELVKSEILADLCVYVTKREIEAKGKDEIWCFVNHSPDKKVQFVSHFGDLKVFYVNSKIKAKWRKPHKLQKRLG